MGTAWGTFDYMRVARPRSSVIENVDDIADVTDYASTVQSSNLCALAVTASQLLSSSLRSFAAFSVRGGSVSARPGSHAPGSGKCEGLGINIRPEAGRSSWAKTLYNTSAVAAAGTSIAAVATAWKQR